MPELLPPHDFCAADYLKRQKLSGEGTKVRVTADKAKNPARMDNFKIEVEIPAGLSEEHVKCVQEAVHRCLIHNTLTHPPKIELEAKGLAETSAK